MRRDFDALEKRRLEAIRLLGRGFNQSEAARRKKVVRQRVARWAKEYREGGKTALKTAGRAGRKPRLSAEDKQRLEQLLLKGLKRLVMKRRFGPARASRI